MFSSDSIENSSFASTSNATVPQKSEKDNPVYFDTLSEEQKEKILELDDKTDRIFFLRGRLAHFFRTYRKYLVVDRTSQAESKKSAGSLLKNIRELKINTDTVTADAPLRYFNVADEALVATLFRHEVEMALQQALVDYEQLVVLAGVWKQPSDLFTEETQQVREYYTLRYHEGAEAVLTLEKLEGEWRRACSALEVLRSAVRYHSRPALLSLVRNAEVTQQSLVKQIQELLHQDPYVYLHFYTKALQDAKKAYDQQGGIIETQYVKQKIAEILGHINLGKPVFLHGELGSGKTELLFHLARTKFSGKHVKRWKISNPQPQLPADQNSISEATYRRQLTDWEARLAEEQQPLFLAGHRGVEAEQMIGTRTIQRPAVLPPEEQTKEISAKWESFSSALKMSYGQLSSAETVGLEHWLATQQRVFEEAYLRYFQAPSEMKVVFGPLLKAMMQGRPYIEDETNAIPHHLQIVKNDLLSRKVGDWIYPNIPGAEPFQVQDGFVFLCTGNYRPEEGSMYVGRQVMDAAYLSRFGLVSYDYLPMQDKLEEPGASPEDQRAHRQRNELYHMLVTRLLDSDLSLTIPQSAMGSTGSLYRLAMVARVIQDVFSGKDVDQMFYAQSGSGMVKPKEVLKENVLSIRHLLGIVDQWKKDGFIRELDHYIYQYYVQRSSARPEEMNYLYQILRVQGDFFSEKNGWPTTADRKAIRDGEIVLNNMKTTVTNMMFGAQSFTASTSQVPHAIPDLVTSSPREVIEMLFGPVPERRLVPIEVARMFGAVKETDVNETVIGELQDVRLRKTIANEIDQLIANLFNAGIKL